MPRSRPSPPRLRLVAVVQDYPQKPLKLTCKYGFSEGDLRCTCGVHSCLQKSEAGVNAAFSSVKLQDGGKNTVGPALLIFPFFFTQKLELGKSGLLILSTLCNRGAALLNSDGCLWKCVISLIATVY